MGSRYWKQSAVAAASTTKIEFITGCKIMLNSTPFPPSKLTACTSHHHHHNTLSTSSSSSSSSLLPPNHDYILNVGTAIRVLRHELPHFFNEGLQTTSIYSPHMRLIEPYQQSKIEGLTNYKLLANAIRYSTLFYFSDINFAITRIEELRQHHIQDSSDGDGRSNVSGGGGGGNLPNNSSLSSSSLETGNNSHIQLYMKWIFEGRPRIHTLISNLNHNDTFTEPALYEGAFVYSFDESGFIKSHSIQYIEPAPPFLSALSRPMLAQKF